MDWRRASCIGDGSWRSNLRLADVHKDTIAVALGEAGQRGEVREYGKVANTPAALKASCAKLARNGAKLRFCYACARNRRALALPQRRQCAQDKRARLTGRLAKDASQSFKASRVGKRGIVRQSRWRMSWTSFSTRPFSQPEPDCRTPGQKDSGWPSPRSGR
jgi:hypothetical protein